MDDSVDAALRRAVERGLTVDVITTPTGRRRGCRTDELRVGPTTEADPAKWETALLLLLADRTEASCPVQDRLATRCFTWNR